MTEQTPASRKAYNLTMTVDSVETPTDTNGKEFLRSKVTLQLRGKQRKRTLIAQGKAADAVRDVLVAGQEAKIRCLFDNVVNDAGEEGGEFLVAVGLPLPPKDKAAA